MLVSMKSNHEEYNNNTSFHGCREEVEVSSDGLVFIKTYADTSHEWWAAFAEDGAEILVDAKEEVQKGVWVTLGGNFHSDISDSINLKNNHSLWYVSDDGVPICDLKATQATRPEQRAEYMVCDNVEQALEYWKGAIENPVHKYVIALMPIKKANEPEKDGWRWHKWGAYIGSQNPQCEYIVDEPEIDMVYCAHIYNVEEV